MKPTIVFGSTVSVTPIKSDELDVHLQHRYYSIISFENSTNRIITTPDSGEYKIESSETGKTWGVVGTIQASNTGPTGDYERPTASGSLKFTRVTPSSVTGPIVGPATFFEMTVNAFAE